MKKKIALIFLILVITFINAHGIENSFKELGYDDFIVDGQNKSKCYTYYFLTYNGEYYPIVSLSIELAPTYKGNFNIEVFVNNILQKIINKENITQPYTRIFIDKNILKENNELKLCGNTYSTITKIIVKNNSKIGFYKEAVFKKEKFIKTAKEKAIIGEELTVKIIVTNEGTKEALVDLNYMRKIIEEKKFPFEVIGNVYFTGTIKPNETKLFSYKIKALEFGLFSLPPASLEYENVFGERQLLLSNPLAIEVLPKPLNVELFTEKIFLARNESSKIKVSITNPTANTINNLSIAFDIKPLDEINQTPKPLFIEIIEPNSTLYKEIIFTAPNKDTKLIIGCTYSFDSFSYSCDGISIFVEEIPLFKIISNILIILSFVTIVFLAMLWYVYIYYPKRFGSA